MYLYKYENFKSMSYYILIFVDDAKSFFKPAFISLISLIFQYTSFANPHNFSILSMLQIDKRLVLLLMM